jgi:hypothetical protein
VSEWENEEALSKKDIVEAKPRPCGAFLGPGAPQGEPLAQPGNLANSVSLEPVVLVLLAPFKSEDLN